MPGWRKSSTGICITFITTFTIFSTIYITLLITLIITIFITLLINIFIALLITIFTTIICCRMFGRCFSHGQYRQALGIAIETRRLDVFKRAVASGDQTDGQICDMVSYAFRVVMSLIQKRDYRWELLHTLVDLYRSLAKPDYVQVISLVFLTFFGISVSLVSIF